MADLILPKDEVQTARGERDEFKSLTEPPGWFHEGQRDAWKSPKIDIVVVSGTQGGKTSMQAPWLLREIQRCAPLIKKLGNGKFIYAGPTLTLMSEQAIPAFEVLFQEQEQLGRLIKGNKPKFHFSAAGLERLLGFSNCPVTVTFAYTNDSSNLESMTALAGVWDESGQKENKQSSYRAFNRRLKVARSTTFGMIREWLEETGQLEDFAWWIRDFYDVEGPDATFGRRLWGTTPYEWNWFKTDVYDPAFESQAQGNKSDWDFFNFPSWMNPNVSEAECRKELENGMPDWEWEMLYMGLYRRPAGLVYDCFDRLNIIEPFEIPREWVRWIGLDFGSANTGAVILAEDPDTDDLIQYAEYLAGSKTFKEHVDDLKELAGCTPTGAGGSHQEEGWREAFRKNGLSLAEPPTNDVKVQVGCVYGEVKTRKYKIFKTCSKTIGEFQNFSRVLDDNLQPTEQFKDEKKFHRLAAVRYVVSHLRPPKDTPPPQTSAPTVQKVADQPPPEQPRFDAQGRFIPPRRNR